MIPVEAPPRPGALLQGCPPHRQSPRTGTRHDLRTARAEVARLCKLRGEKGRHARGTLQPRGEIRRTPSQLANSSSLSRNDSAIHSLGGDGPILWTHPLLGCGLICEPMVAGVASTLWSVGRRKQSRLAKLCHLGRWPRSGAGLKAAQTAGTPAWRFSLLAASLLISFHGPASPPAILGSTSSFRSTIEGTPRSGGSAFQFGVTEVSYQEWDCSNIANLVVANPPEQSVR